MLGKIFSAGAGELIKNVGGVIDSLHTSDEEKAAAEAKIMIANGFAIEGESKPKRARNAKGHLMADDPSTPENEAWEGGVAPKKKKA